MESDEVITLYTREFGMIEVVGKSIRKNASKLRMNVPLFSLTEIGFIQGKSYNTLTDARVVSFFKEAKRDIKRLSLLYRLSEVIITLIKGEEKDEKVFRFILRSFQKISELSLTREGVKTCYYHFVFRLMALLGHGIDTQRCAICGEKVKKRCYFSPGEGEVFCISCFGEKKKEAYFEDSWFLEKISKKS